MNKKRIKPGKKKLANGEPCITERGICIELPSGVIISINPLTMASSASKNSRMIKIQMIKGLVSEIFIYPSFQKATVTRANSVNSHRVHSFECPLRLFIEPDDYHSIELHFKRVYSWTWQRVLRRPAAGHPG